MRKSFLIFLLLFPALVSAQTLLRYSAPVISISSSTSTPYLVANIPPSAPTLAVCNSPANAVPCTNYATTYTGAGATCPNGAQDTPDPQPSSCQTSGDGQGNIGFWAPAGTYAWTACIPNSLTCYGPYTITLGGGGSFVAGASSGSGAYLGNWMGSPYPLNPAGSGVWSTTTANTVECFQFQLYFPFTFDTLTWFPVTGATATLGVGVYGGDPNLSSYKTRLIHWDSIPGSAGFGQDITATPTGGAVTLQPESYYWCFASSVTTGTTLLSLGSLANGNSNENAQPWNHSIVRTGAAANLMSSGVLPTTLGTLTAGFPNGNSALPMWTVEPN